MCFVIVAFPGCLYLHFFSTAELNVVSFQRMMKLCQNFNTKLGLLILISKHIRAKLKHLASKLMKFIHLSGTPPINQHSCTIYSGS